jgi:hypothetical protein
MALVEINWRPGARELRKFGVAMIVGFGLLAALAYWRASSTTTVEVLLGVGVFAGLLGLTGTRAALVVYWPWMAIAFVMGNVMSRVLVTLFFFGVITPMGLLMRLLRRDKLQRRNIRSSYWDDLPPSKPSGYERQF